MPVLVPVLLVVGRKEGHPGHGRSDRTDRSQARGDPGRRGREGGRKEEGALAMSSAAA